MMTEQLALDGGRTLEEARDWLRDQLMPGGVRSTQNRIECPCCKRKAQLYRRHIHAEAARGLIVAYKLGAAEQAVHVSREIPGYQNTDFARSAYWGLIEEIEPAEHNGDGGRSGWWKLTAKGRAFVLDTEPLEHKYVWIYADRPLAFDGGEWSIYNALRNKFSYAELMAPVKEGMP